MQPRAKAGAKAGCGITPKDLGGGVEIQFLYGGDVVYGRRWPTRELAVAETDDKFNVQRDGWATPG